MPQLIFLPGASGNTAFFHPLIEKIEKLPWQNAVKIVAYPEFNHQPAHSQVHDFASLQAYVLANIPDDCIIIAQSMGGIFAVAAALQYPEKVKGLVLVATSGGMDLSSFQVQDWRQDYQASDLNYPDWFVEAKADYTVDFAKINMPILLLWGDQDPISPLAVGEFLQQQLPQAELKIVQGGDHLFIEEHADQAAKYISAYLSQLDLGAQLEPK
ncbi:alpha/beta fold hydrolase [Acinetobacter sp. YH16058]|uniref:alpha/beta fold hydrolase n=1 Tax=Acinetobacter sp. YH16058 TaxID=2601196 RepID=UPI0015D1B5EE|nr:alpha/beta hydrolase [Acinetobacter sp. YH16058]